MEEAPFLFETNFSTLDWGIVVTYILSMGAVGMLVNKYIHTVSDYMVGGTSHRTGVEYRQLYWYRAGSGHRDVRFH